MPADAAKADYLERGAFTWFTFEMTALGQRVKQPSIKIGVGQNVALVRIPTSQPRASADVFYPADVCPSTRGRDFGG